MRKLVLLFSMCLIVFMSSAQTPRGQYLLEKAKAGDALAQYKIADGYACGNYGLTENSGEAMKWYLKAAENGLASAQCEVANNYQNGWNDFPEDEKKAAYWYKKAALQDWAEAQYELGYLYSQGEGGLPEDEDLAYDWNKKAAYNGYPTAMSSYAYDLKFEGKKQEAIDWYKKALDDMYELGEVEPVSLNHVIDELKRECGVVYHPTGLKRVTREFMKTPAKYNISDKTTLFFWTDDYKTGEATLEVIPGKKIIITINGESIVYETASFYEYYTSKRTLLIGEDEWLFSDYIELPEKFIHSYLNIWDAKSVKEDLYLCIHTNPETKKTYVHIKKKDEDGKFSTFIDYTLKEYFQPR